MQSRHDLVKLDLEYAHPDGHEVDVIGREPVTVLRVLNERLV